MTNLESSGPNTLHLFPSFLPDGRHLLYLRVSRANPSENGLYIADRTLPPAAQRPDRIVETGFLGEYAAASDGSGRILFVRDRVLMAVPFDVDRLALTGEPVQIAAPIGTFRDGAFFHANKDLLIYRGGVPDYQLTWLSRKGEHQGVVGEPGHYLGASLSPDGALAAVVRENRLNGADQDLWLVDLLRNTTIRFTTDPLPESIPTWSADGKALMFGLGHDVASVWTKPLDGGPSRTLLPATALTDVRVNPLFTTLSATADGRFLTFTVDSRAATRSDIWLLQLQEKGGAAVPLLQQEFDQVESSISPGGHWLAYVSNESGVNEVFVRPLTSDPQTGLPSAGAASVISRGGGRAPRWRADARELFYLSSTGAVMAADARPSAFGSPVALFQTPGALPHWGVSQDGQRFLFALPAGQSTPAPFSVVLNWQAALRP